MLFKTHIILFLLFQNSSVPRYKYTQNIQKSTKYLYGSNEFNFHILQIWALLRSWDNGKSIEVQNNESKMITLIPSVYNDN